MAATRPHSGRCHPLRSGGGSVAVIHRALRVNDQRAADRNADRADETASRPLTVPLMLIEAFREK